MGEKRKRAKVERKKGEKKKGKKVVKEVPIDEPKKDLDLDGLDDMTLDAMKELEREESPKFPRQLQPVTTGNWKLEEERREEKEREKEKEKVKDKDIEFLRPSSWDEYIGNEGMVRKIKTAIEASKITGEVLDHVLFSGPSGVGKTTAALIIGKEMGVNVYQTSGSLFKNLSDIYPFLKKMKRGDILFIDEIHQMNKLVTDFLNPISEVFCIDIKQRICDKNGCREEIKREYFEKFTIIAATTRVGKLDRAFKNRFRYLSFELDYHTKEDMTLIIGNGAKKIEKRYGLSVDVDAILEIANRCKLNPRVANGFLLGCRDIAIVKGIKIIDKSVVEESSGVDSKGLDNLDRKILNYIYDSKRPIGLKNIKSYCGKEEDEDILERERYLIFIEFMIRGKNGRELLDKGYEYLGVTPEEVKKVTNLGDSGISPNVDNNNIDDKDILTVDDKPTKRCGDCGIILTYSQSYDLGFCKDCIKKRLE